MRARRALLYVPGADWRKIEKAKSLNADSVCLDLEDGVAANRKAEARSTVARAFSSLNFGKSERLARINAVGSGFEVDDLAVVGLARPDGLIIPKVSSAIAIQWTSDQLASIERKMNWSVGSIYLLALIENARGVVNLSQIAEASPRVQALIFGAEDYAADVGAIRTPGGNEVLYARSAVVAYAAAYGLQAIDLVFRDYRDPEGLSVEARGGAELGFAGKQVIHPDQIEAVQEAFTPNEAQIAEALNVVQAAGVNLRAGSGAFAVDNKMVDMPVIRAAERVLARARVAGKLERDG